MKLISKATVHYGKGKIAPAGALFDVEDDTGARLIEGGYAEAYAPPKTAAQIEADVKKAAKADEAGGDL